MLRRHATAIAASCAKRFTSTAAIVVATTRCIAIAVTTYSCIAIAIAITATSDCSQSCRLLPDLAFRIREWQHRHVYPVRNLFGLPSRPRLLGIGLVHVACLLWR